MRFAGVTVLQRSIDAKVDAVNLVQEYIGPVDPLVIFLPGIRIEVVVFRELVPLFWAIVGIAAAAKTIVGSDLGAEPDIAVAGNIQHAVSRHQGLEGIVRRFIEILFRLLVDGLLFQEALATGACHRSYQENCAQLDFGKFSPIAPTI